MPRIQERESEDVVETTLGYGGNNFRYRVNLAALSASWLRLSRGPLLIVANNDIGLNILYLVYGALSVWSLCELIEIVKENPIPFNSRIRTSRGYSGKEFAV